MKRLTMIALRWLDRALMLVCVTAFGLAFVGSFTYQDTTEGMTKDERDNFVLVFFGGTLAAFIVTAGLGLCVSKLREFLEGRGW